MTDRAVAGIDVSKARPAVRASGENGGFANGRNGFRALHGRLRERKVTDVVTEATGRYRRGARQSLCERGHTVHAVNPLRPGASARRSASSRNPTGSTRRRRRVRRGRGASGVTAETGGASGLEELSVAREALVDMRTALEARIRESPKRRLSGN